MLVDLVVEKHWDTIKERIKTRYGMVTDDDLEKVKTNPRLLTGTIQEKTGRPMNEIENFLERILEEECTMADQVQGRAKEMMENTTQAVQEQYGKVSKAVQEGYGKAETAMREGYHQGEDLVRRNPAESVMVSFGAGLIAGMVIGLLARGR